MSNKILTLRICSKGFAKLATGKVQYKYCPAKNYWQKRLFDAEGNAKLFNAVHIKNGYIANSPVAICEFKGISPKIEMHEGQPCYRIELGKSWRYEITKKNKSFKPAIRFHPGTILKKITPAFSKTKQIACNI